MTDDKDESWGVEFNFNTWTVGRFNPFNDGQFRKLEVEVGNEIFCVNGMSVWNEPWKCRKLLTERAACEITFGDPGKVLKTLNFCF